MANFIELTNRLGPMAINIDHIRSFHTTDAGTAINIRGEADPETVDESYEVVRGMLSVTPAPQPHLNDLVDKPEDLVLKA